MKKHLHYLWATMFAVAALPAAAQTADDPQKLVVGENTIESVAYSEFYLTYTPTQNEIVKLDGIYLTYSEEITVTDAAGNESFISAATNYNPEFSVFMAEKGNTYLIHHIASNREEDYPLHFNCEVTPVSGNPTGPSCEEAMTMPETGSFLFPCTGVSYYETTPVYVKFTAPFTGRLSFYVTSMFKSLMVGTTCGEYDIELSYEYDSNGLYPYLYEIAVEEDETIIFEAESSGMVYAEISFKEVELGGSCKDAFTGKAGANVLPAAAGEYWYTLACPDDMASCMIVSKSDSKASANVYFSCSNTYQYFEYESLNFRCGPVVKGNSRMLCVNKTEATAADETFEITYDALLPIENEDEGEPIEAGKEYTTPGGDSTYYYSITSPEGDPTIMSVTSNAEGNSSSKVHVNPLGSYYPTIGDGANFKGQVEPGTEYLVAVTAEAGTPVTFTVDFEKLAAGALTSYPIMAELGDNEVPAFSPVYYNFSDPDGCKVELSTDVEGVEFVVINKSDWSSTPLSLETTDNGLAFVAKPGSNYQITLTKPEGSEATTGSLVLTALPFGPGEAWQSAIETGAGTVTLPDGPSEVWYKLVAPQDGFLNMETTMKFDWSSYIYYYIGSVSDANKKNASQTGDYPDYKYVIKQGVSKDEVIYVCFINNLQQPAPTATFSFTDAEPGQVASNPLKLDYQEGGITVDVASNVTSTSPVWYSIELPAGVLDMLSEQSINFNLYNADDTSQPVKTGGYLNNKYGLQGFSIPEAGAYLFEVTSTYSDGAKLNITVREPNPGETMATAIELDTTELPAEVEVPNLVEGTSYWIKMNAHTGDLNVTTKPGQTLTARLFSAENPTEVLVETEYSYENDEYTSVIKDYAVATDGVYYLEVVRCYDKATLVFSGSALEAPDYINVNVEIVDGQAYSFTLPNETESTFALNLPENWKVESVELNGEAVEAAPNYTVAAAGEDMDYVFTVAYDGDIQFIDSTTGLVEIDAKVKICVVEGKIRIEGTVAGDQITVYNMGGLLVGSYTAQNTALEIALPAGTYVVLVNQSAVKVLL